MSGSCRSGWSSGSNRPIWRASRQRPVPAHLRPSSGGAINAFWFAHHVAAMTAFGRLSGRDAYPYRGNRDELAVELARFILRGIGLTDAAIETHLAAAMLWQPAAA